MTDLARLRIAIDTKNIGAARRELDRLEKQSRRNERAAGSMGGAFRMLGGILAGVGVAQAARSFVRMGDEVTQLTGRISLYTDTLEDAQDVVTDLRESATDLGIAFGSQAEIFARLGPSLENLNLSNERALDLTEAISTAFVVSGASAQEADNAIRQLGQAFASGELRGEELRSVMEQGARIMQALRDETGLTQGELRELAEAGQLTSDVVSEALLAQLPTLREELDQMEETVGRASTALRNELAIALQDVNEQMGLTRGLANIFRGIADDLQGQRIGLQVAGDEEGLREQLDILREAANEIERVAANGGRAAAIEGQARVLLGNDAVNDIREATERGENYGERYAEALVDALLEKQLEVRGALAELLRAGDSSEGRSDPAGANLAAQRAAQEAADERLAELNAAKAKAEDLAAEARERELDAAEDLERLALRQLEHEIELADLRGDDRTVQNLEDELRLRERIAELTGLGVEEAEARSQAERERAAIVSDRARGEYRETFRDAFSEGFLAMLDGNGDALSNWWRSNTERALRNVLDALADEFFELMTRGGSSGGGDSGGWIRQGLNFLFGGNRAAGGPVSAGRSYMVGENGPERFIPNVPGRISPNGGERVVERVVVVSVDRSDLFTTAVQEAAAPVAAQAGRSAYDAQRRDQAQAARKNRLRV